MPHRAGRPCLRAGHASAHGRPAFSTKICSAMSDLPKFSEQTKIKDIPRYSSHLLNPVRL